MKKTDELKVDEKALMTLLSDLVSIDSVNPCLGHGGAGETNVAHYIGKRLESMGLGVEYNEIGPQRMNVIGVLRGTGEGPALMLNGHMDTVTAHSMEIEPFKPVFKDGKLYGRGALDMKSGIAAQIMAVETIIKAGLCLKGDIIMAGVADEEYVSLGTETLLQDYRADAAIICEPTNLRIVTAHKGFAWIEFEIFGKAAHGSLREGGIDAIMKAGKILKYLDEMNRNTLSKVEHPLLGPPSLHTSMIKGGTEWSTYPDYCKSDIERRTLPGESKDSIAREMDKMIAEIAKDDPDFNVEYDIACYRQPFEIPDEAPIVKTLEDSCRWEMNKKPDFSGVAFWMDAALLNAAGIPTVIFGPSGEGLHAAVEYVDFKSVVTTTNVLIRSILDFCNQGICI